MTKNRIIPSDSVAQLLHSVAQLLYEADEHTQSCITYYQIQARMIIEHLTKTSIVHQLYNCLSKEQYQELENILEEHIKHSKPLAYCFGSVEFLSLMLAIQPPILIPRPETEAWVAHYINRYENALLIPSTILDMCTGSGAIALAFAHAFIKSRILGIDSNPQAITLAITNKDNHKIDNLSFVQSNLYDEISRLSKFDLIVSNPPYLSAQEWHNLERSVKQWEDPQALYADQNGLGLIKKIIMQAPDYLSLTYYELYKQKKLPNIVIEIGHTQAEAVLDILHACDALNIRVHKDIAKNDRYVEALLAPTGSI